MARPREGAAPRTLHEILKWFGCDAGQATSNPFRKVAQPPRAERPKTATTAKPAATPASNRLVVLTLLAMADARFAARLSRRHDGEVSAGRP
jgi:hypothetical protein